MKSHRTHTLTCCDPSPELLILLLLVRATVPIRRCWLPCVCCLPRRGEHAAFHLSLSAFLGQKRGCDPPPEGRSRSLGLDTKVAPNTPSHSHTCNFALRILSLIRLKLLQFFWLSFLSLALSRPLSRLCFLKRGGMEGLCLWPSVFAALCVCVALRARSVLYYVSRDKKQAERDARRSKSIAAHLLAPLNILLARKLATRG